MRANYSVTRQRRWDRVTGTLTITDFDGVSRKISADPRNGFKPQLIEAGRSFGVIRLVSDPPHWLDDGH